jgi:charged multivesicular body protein 6
MGCESANENRHQKVINKNISLTNIEQAILQCKQCRDKIKGYIRNLENKEKKSKEKAKELLRNKQKERAKLYLKQCKLFREQSKVADSQLDIINQQISNIESTSNMSECMSCLKQGNTVLKQLQKEVNIEHWEDIRDDLEELKERDREIGEFFRERGIDEEEYEDECENELNKLLFEIQDTNNLPNVPKTKITEDKQPIKQNKVKKKIIAS